MILEISPFMTFIYFCTWSLPFSTHFSQRQTIFLKPHERTPQFVPSSRSWLFFPPLHMSHTGMQNSDPAIKESSAAQGEHFAGTWQRQSSHHANHHANHHAGSWEDGSHHITTYAIQFVLGTMPLPPFSRNEGEPSWMLQCCVLVSRKSLRVTPTASQKPYPWLSLPTPGFCGPAMHSRACQNTHHK